MAHTSEHSIHIHLYVDICNIMKNHVVKGKYLIQSKAIVCHIVLHYVIFGSIIF